MSPQEESWVGYSIERDPEGLEIEGYEAHNNTKVQSNLYY